MLLLLLLLLQRSIMLLLLNCIVLQLPHYMLNWVILCIMKSHVSPLRLQKVLLLSST